MFYHILSGFVLLNISYWIPFLVCTVPGLLLILKFACVFFLFLATIASCCNSQDTKPRLVVQLARVVTAHVLSGVKSELKAIEYLINELLKLNSVLSWLHWSLASFHVSPWSFCWIKMHVLLVSPPTRQLLSGEVAGSLSLSLTQWVTRSSPSG